MRKNSYKPKMYAKVITILISYCLIILTALNINNIVMAYEESDTNLEEEVNSLRAPYASQAAMGDFSPNDASILNTVPQTNEISTDEEVVVYLSDLDYITKNNWSYNGWSGHSITKDQNQENGPIRLKINNEVHTFTKGIVIHAKGQATYDISKYSTKYPRFMAYLGLDVSKTQEANFWIQILASRDGETWDSLYKTGNIRPNSNAVAVDLNVEGYKYLRIYVDPNGGNAADHGTLGDARFVTRDYVPVQMPEYDKVHPLSYYDDILKNHDAVYNYEHNYQTLLKREVVRKLGYDTIKSLTSTETKRYRNLFDWIFDNNNVMEQIIEVGNFQSKNFINDLVSIYEQYKGERNSPNWYVYQKVMIALCAAHTSDPLLTPLRFGGYDNYNVLTRFALIKDYFDNDKFMRLTTNSLNGTLVVNDWFKSYSVPLMRTVVHEAMSDIDYKWMNGYSHDKIAFDFWVVPYISPNYNQARFYDEANRQKYTQKYLLDKYNVPYGAGSGQHYWMVIEGGGICWNQSRFGQALYRVNGLPAVGAYQPGHECFFNYYQDANGNGYWTGRYGNWGNAGTTWGGACRVRYPLDWANKYFADQNISGSKGASSSGYLYLAQANLNKYAEYQKSIYYNLSANSYTDNSKKLEAYFKSLEVNNLNLDTYDYIISLYKKMSVKNPEGTITSSDWRTLSLKIIDSYTYYPVAMYDLLKVIRPYLEGADRLEIDRLEKEALTKATRATSSVTNSAEGTKTHANWLLGKAQPDPITFSFDGANAGKIIRNSIYQIAWGYSLDGGNTFTEQVNADFITLTQEELATITAENDIIINFMGLTYTFRVDIQESAGLPSTLYANDLENALMATTPSVQWKLNEADNWTSYKDAQPDLTGNKTVIVRMGATGIHLPSKNSVTYTFTEDNVVANRKYIPIKHLSINSVSSQATAQGRHAKNAIDGNIKTNWHSAWDGSDRQKFIVIELDEIKNLTALEFFPVAGGNGKIESAQILTSTDGTNWTEVVSETNWRYQNANDVSMKSVEFEATRAKYIKIVGKRTQSASSASFIAVSMFNLYEDTTKVIVGRFSFDGENAGKIILEDEYRQLNWEYSLDGGITWKQGTQEAHQLTAQEMNRINENDKIKIRFEGNEVQYTLNIKKGTTPNVTPYVNDWENTLIGLPNQNIFEWKLENSSEWTDYKTEIPRVKGNTKLLIRAKATGTTTAGNILQYQFTQDTDTNTKKYIPIKHLSIHDKISQSIDSSRPYYAPNAIDGNINTLWHTDFRVSLIETNTKGYIIIKLDSERYISALEFAQKRYRTVDPCFTKNAIVYVSQDANEWTEVGRKENCEQNEELNRIEFDESVIGQYVKLELETYNMFAAISMINLYEDITKLESPTAQIEYSTTDLTNQDVTATLVNENREITVTNNNGSKTYTFTENGIFTFEFIDSNGIRGTATATVDWICKTLPNATFSYSITPTQDKPKTNQNVTVTIDFDRDGTEVTNNNGSKTHTFTENGEFIFEFVGPYGNAGTATAKVDWIDKVPPVATINYSAEYATNQDIIATITFDKENVKIVDDHGQEIENGNTYTFTENGTHEFRYVDIAGNTGTKTAQVTWIDKTLPKATITYDIMPTQDKPKTNQDVIATIHFDDENVMVVDENGQEIEDGKTFTFVENGVHEFKFKKPSGNTGIAIAKVDWIDKIAPKATIEYSTTELTNKEVTATIHFNKENVTITNNGGSATYIFTENNTFIFEFEDQAGNTGTQVAEVVWIDKILPRATITYDINTITNQNVIATITFDKANVKIVDDHGQEIENGNTYTFTENGRHEFIFIGPAGNRGTAVAEVTWIDKIPPKATITYDISKLTNKNVTATVTFDEGGVTIINDKGEEIQNGTTYVFTQNGSHTFRYRGPLGNIGTAVATVNWIDKVAPTAEIQYSTTQNTNGNVVATLINPSKEITIINNGGKNTYNFTQNGEFTFEFVDKLGNRGSATATVLWIKKDEDNPSKYEIGDVNQDGKIRATDLLLVQRHLVSSKRPEWVLTGEAFKLGDINQDGKITATDLLLIQRLVLKHIKK